MMKKQTLTLALAFTCALVGSAAAMSQTIKRGLSDEEISNHSWAFIDSSDKDAYVKNHRISDDDKKRMITYINGVVKINEEIEESQNTILRQLAKKISVFFGIAGTCGTSMVGMTLLTRIRPTTTDKESAIVPALAIPIAALLYKLQQGTVGKKIRALKREAADALMAKDTKRYDKVMESLSSWYATQINALNVIFGTAIAGGFIAFKTATHTPQVH